MLFFPCLAVHSLPYTNRDKDEVAIENIREQIDSDPPENSTDVDDRSFFFPDFSIFFSWKLEDNVTNQSVLE